jgi:hypothetical protein
MSDQLHFSFQASREARREAGARAFRRKIDCTAPEARHDAKSRDGQAAGGPVPTQDETTPPVAPRGVRP